MKWFVGLLGLSLMLGMSFACGGDDDDDDDSNAFIFSSCPEICSAAQAASCTVVDCDCNNFCSSLEAFKSKGGCGGAANAYETCAFQNAVCTISGSCNAEENAVIACVAQYCATNATDPDCVFLQTC